MKKDKNYQENEEYRLHCRIAAGTSTSDLQAALNYHRDERGYVSLLLIMLGLKDEPLHVRAFEDALKERQTRELAQSGQAHQTK